MSEKKPDAALREKIKRRGEKALSKRPALTPSQKRSENIRKKLRNKDGKKCPIDFIEPVVLKDE
jgi:hypothetical protein